MIRTIKCPQCAHNGKSSNLGQEIEGHLVKTVFCYGGCGYKRGKTEK